MRRIAEQRLIETTRKLKELTTISETLHQLVHHCHGEGDLAGCPIIEAVRSAEAPAAATTTWRTA